MLSGVAVLVVIGPVDSTGGRPPELDHDSHRRRNTVERCFNKLKQFRAVVTRYEKRAYVYDGTIDVASIKIWLRDLTRQSDTT